MTTPLYLYYPGGDLATVESAAGLGDAQRLVRQLGLRRGWVEDGDGNRIADIIEGQLCTTTTPRPGKIRPCSPT